MYGKSLDNNLIPSVRALVMGNGKTLKFVVYEIVTSLSEFFLSLNKQCLNYLANIVRLNTPVKTMNDNIKCFLR